MFTDNEFAVGMGVARGDHDALVAGFVAHQGDMFHPESAGQLGDRHRIDVGRIGPPGHQRGHPAQRRLLLGKRAHRDVAVLELAPGLLAGALQGGVDLLAVAGSGEKRLQRRHHSANPLRRRGGQPRRHLQAAHRHLGIVQRDRLVVGVGGDRIDGEGGVRKFQDVGHSATRGVQRGGEIDGPQHDARQLRGQIGLTATLVRLRGAQPGLSDEDVGEQRERQEDDDRGREAAAALVDVEPDIGQGAGQ